MQAFPPSNLQALCESRRQQCPGLRAEYVPPISGDSSVMLVGECPAIHDAQSQIPFSGPAGGLLRQAWSEGTGRLLLPYTTLLVKQRPISGPGSPSAYRPVSKEEMWVFRDLLFYEISHVRPSVIVACGASVAAALAGKDYVSVARQLKSIAMLKVPTQDPAVDLTIPVVVTWAAGYVHRAGGQGTQAYHEMVGRFRRAFEIITKGL